MSGDNTVSGENNLEVVTSQENCSINRDSSDESKVASENIPTSGEHRGTKRRLDEDAPKSEIPKVLKDMFKPLKCELCNVIVGSTVTAFTHYEGKTHKKNVNAYLKKHFNIETTSTKSKKSFEQTRCEVCDVTLTSEIVYQQHFAGKQHRKNVKRGRVDPVIPVTKVEVDPTGRFGIGKAFLKETEQPSQSTPALVSGLYCEICTVFTDTEEQMLIHKQGKKHSKNVEKRKLIENQSLSTTK